MIVNEISHSYSDIAKYNQWSESIYKSKSTNLIIDDILWSESESIKIYNNLNFCKRTQYPKCSESENSTELFNVLIFYSAKFK